MLDSYHTQAGVGAHIRGIDRRDDLAIRLSQKSVRNIVGIDVNAGHPFVVFYFQTLCSLSRSEASTGRVVLFERPVLAADEAVRHIIAVEDDTAHLALA